MPHVVRVDGTKGNPIYQVGGKSFVFFRNARRDAPFPDVIVIWVESEADKLALVQDPGSPRSSPPITSTGIPRCWYGRVSFTGSASVSWTELIQDAWLAQASKRRGQQWLADRAP